MIATKTLLISALTLGLASAVPVPGTEILSRQNVCPDGYYPRVDCEGCEKCQGVVPGCPKGYFIDASDDTQCISLPL